MTTIGPVFIGLRLVSGMNAREHWAVRMRRAKKHRGDTALALKLSVKFDRLMLNRDDKVVVSFVAIGGNRMDSDNLSIAFKSIRDGVADWLGVDDRDQRIRWECLQRPKKRNETRGVTITITVRRCNDKKKDEAAGAIVRQDAEGGDRTSSGSVDHTSPT